MADGIAWVLLVVLVWAILFVLALSFGRAVARAHDLEGQQAVAMAETGDTAATPHDQPLEPATAARAPAS
jgi:hypothetical protein